ncbi:filamentous hemagglutinin N-terminal domain-containing protein, partial [Salinicola socius]
MNARSNGFRYLAITLINALFWHPVLVLADGIVVSSGGGNTHLDQAGNGVPVIDIATPNGKGLSHNTFSDYNVDQRGLILNNATTKWQDTQLAGKIVGNPNLRDRAASLIVNEVNGGSPSRLAGYTEVAGARANVVVANPYGITCDGCGFINSPRVTLSTGKPIVENGELDHYAVERGQVAIEGLGLDATQVDQFDIITRAAKLNADIHAHRLDIVTGANDVSADDLSATPRAGKGATPALALDASTLGGMYADRISLIGTEAGVGVRVAGDMAASAGDIVIDAAGHLELSDTAAARRLDVRAASIDAEGQLRGERRLAIHATGDMALYSNVSSAGDISLEAGGKITQQGEVIAGVEESKRLEGRRLTVHADRIDNHGRLDATQQLKIDGRVASNHGQLLANEIAVTARDAIDNTATIQGQSVSLDTASLHNDRSDATIAAERDLDLRAPRIVNRGDLRFGSGQDVILDIDSLDNQKGRFLLDDGDLDLKAVELVNDDGVVHADGLSMAGQTLSNRNGGLIDASAGGAKLDFDRQIDNSSGQLQATGALHLTGGDVSNRRGKILAATLTLEGDSLDNRNGLISSRTSDVAIGVTRRLDNDAGHIEAKEALTLKARSLDNHAGVMLADRVKVAADSLANEAGTVSAEQGNLYVEARENLDNDGGHLQAARGEVIVSADTVTNRQGDLLGRLVNVTVKRSLDNDGGRITATEGALDMTTGGGLDNTQGVLRGSDLRLEMGALTANQSGLISADDGDLQLITHGVLNNASGQLQARHKLTLDSTGTIDNDAGTVVADRVGIDGSSLSNLKSAISAERGDLTIKVGGEIDNTSGYLQALAGDVRLDAGLVINDQGTVSAHTIGLAASDDVANVGGRIVAGEGDLLMKVGGGLDNRDGILIGNALNLESEAMTSNQGGVIGAKDGSVTAKLRNNLDNDGGLIQATKALSLDAAKISNLNGRVIAKDIALTAAELDNRRAGIVSAEHGDATLILSRRLDNDGGTLQAANDLHYQGGDLSSRKGRIIADTLSLSAASLFNQDGLISANAAATNIDVAGDLDNAQGQIQAQDTLKVNAANLDNDGGTLVADSVTLTASAVTNEGGAISAEQGDINIDASNGLDNEGGLIQAVQGVAGIIAGSLTNLQGDLLGRRANVNVKHSLDNGGGRIAATEGDLDLTADGGLDNTRGVLQGSGVRIEVGTLSANQSGLISADGSNLEIIAHGAVNNANGQLQAMNELTLASEGDIDNDAGTVIADSLSVSGHTLSNQRGNVSAEQGNLAISINGGLENTQGVLRGNDVRLETGSLAANEDGLISADEGDLQLVVRGELVNANGQLQALQDLTLDSGAEIDNDAGIIIADSINVDGSALSNREGGISAEQGNLSIDIEKMLDNTQGNLSGQSVNIKALSLNNQEGLISADAGSVSLVVADAVDNVSGTIQAQEAETRKDRIQLESASLDNRAGRIIAGNVGVTVNGDLDNSEGVLLADKASLDLSVAGTLLNRLGQLKAQEEMQLTAATLNNVLGSLLAPALKLHAEGDVSNAGGEMLATRGALLLTAGAGTDNTGGKLVSNRDLTLVANDVINLEGLITTVSGNAEVASKGTTDNRGGTLQVAGVLILRATEAILNEAGAVSAGALELAGGEVNNDGGIISSEQGPLRIDVQRRLGNVDGAIQTGENSDETLSIDAGTIDNRTGRMIAGALQLTGHNKLDNSQGELIADIGSIDLKTGGKADLLNVGGTIQAFSRLGIDAGNWNNTSGTASGRYVESNFQNLANHELGLIVASDGPLELRATGTIENIGGRMQSATHLKMDVSRFDNSHGILLANTLRVASNSLVNAQGILSSIDDMTLRVSDIFDNTAGSVRARDGSLTIEGAATFLNTGGRLASPRLELTVADVDNRRGELISDNVDITAVTLDNREEGLISADAGDLSIAVDNLDNRNGQLQARDTLSVSSESLDNSSGTLVANQVSVDADTLDNNDGVVSAETGSLSLQVFGTLNNVGGYLQALDSVVDLVTDTFDNSNGTLLADTIDLLAQGNVRNQGGRISARRGNLTLEAAGSVDNTGGAIRGDALGIRAASLINSDNGLITADKGGLTLDLEGNLDNIGGAIQAHDDTYQASRRKDIVQIQANGIDNRHGRVVAGEVGLTLRGDLDNTQGILLADRAIMMLDADGQLNNHNGAIEGKSVRISGNSFDNSGGYLGADEGLIDLLLEGSLVNEQGQIQAQDGLTMRAGDLNNDHGKLVAASLALFIDRVLSNHGGGILASDNSLLIDSQGSLDNTGGTLAATGKLELLSGSLINQQGVIASASGDAKLTSQSNIDNDDGRLQAAGELALDAGAAILNAAGIMTADVLQLAGRAFDNTRGIVSAAQGPLSLHIQEGIDNRDGVLQAGDGDSGRLILAADSVDNRKGRMVGGVLDLGTQGRWDNRQGELIADRGELNLDVANDDALLNSEGHIRAATGLKVIAGSWNNDAGLAVGASVNVGLGTLVNRESGLIGTTDGPLDLQIEQNVDNRGGQLQAVGPMSLETGQLNNAHGVLLSDTLRVESDELNNAQGALSSLGKLELIVSRSIDNSAGHILSKNGTIDIHRAQTLINDDGQISASHLELMVDDLDNRRGQLIGDRLELHGGKIDNSDEGLIAAGGDGMLIDAASLDNSKGRLQADGRIDVQTGTLDNTEGVLLADGVRLTSNGFVNDQGAILGGKDGVTLTLDGLGDNRRGVIDAQGGVLQISSNDQTLDNRGGSLSGQQLTFSVDRLDNRANGQIAGRKIELEGHSLLDNRSGRIIADNGALTLGAAAIDNRGGLIQGDSVNLQGDRLDNGNGGLLSSLQGLLKIVLGDRLNNVAGRILANGMLDIDPPLVDNTNGQIAGEEIALTAGRLVNAGGIVEAQSQLSLDAGSIANDNGSLRSLGGERSVLKVEATLDNRSGEIGIGSHDFQLEAGDLLNSLGTMLHAGTGLFTLLADSLNNRDGDVQGTASGSFDVDHLVGTGRWQFNDAITFRTDDILDLDSDERIASAGDLTLDATAIDNNGKLLANGDLFLTSRGDIVNAGTISSQAALNVMARGLSQHDGRIASEGNATYRLSGGLDNLGRLVAGGNIDLQAADIDNRGTLGSQQDLRLVSRSGIDNYADTLLFSGEEMTLRGKRLTNTYGDIYSRGGIDFALDDQRNFADRLENSSGTIEAESNIYLKVADIINKKEVFETSENIESRQIETTNYVAKKYRTYAARNNKNQDWPKDKIPIIRRVFQDYKVIEKSDKKIVLDSAASQIISSGNIDIAAKDMVNENSFVAAGGDLSIRVDRLINRGETEEKKTRITVYAGKPSNLSGYKIRQVSDLKKAYQDDVEELEKDTFSPNRQARPAAETALEALLSEGEPENKTQPAEIVVWNQKGGLDNDRNPLDIPNVVAKKTLESDVTVRQSIGALSPATIQAGGIISIHAAESIGNGEVEESQGVQLQGKGADTDIDAAVSVVDISLGHRKSAHPTSSQPTINVSHDRYDLDATGSDFDFGDTESLQGNAKRTSVGRQQDLNIGIDKNVGTPSRISQSNDEAVATHYVPGSSVSNPDPDDFETPVVDSQRASVSLPIDVGAGTDTDTSRQVWSKGEDGSVVRHVDVDTPRQTSPKGLENSVAVQRIHDQPTDGGDSAASLAPVVGDGIEGRQVATLPSSGVGFAPVDYHGVEFERVSPASLSSFRLPKGDYGLFVKSTAPKSHYLIETNPEFTAVENVIGSDYLLDKLDYSDDSAYQLLGDGRYESRLIRDAIQASTGSRFLDDRLDDDYQQYRYLMDNAITAQDALQLTVGVGLTPEQTAALTHDIVWLESQEIDGETVLAPVLYLAQVDERNVRGGSLIQGRDIELIAGGDLINVGTIKAANDLTMNSGGSILQGGLVEAGNRLDMSAVNDIRNAVAGEIRGRNVSLETLKGDIVNDRTAITAGYGKSYQTYLDAGGLIFSQEDLRLDAGRDLINRSEILSLGAIEANAGRDILLDAVKDSWKEDTAYGAGRIETATTHLGSSLEAANDLVLTAGENISVLGSRVSTGGALELWSGDDITVSALKDSYQRIDTGSGGRKLAEKSTTTQTASQLLSDGRAALAAGRDIDIRASRLDSGADISLTAANDVRIAAGEQNRRTESAGFSHRKTSERVEQVASRIDATGDLTVAAGRDIDMVASRLESGESLRLSAGRDLTLNSAADSLEENYRSSSTKQIHREIRQQGSELRAGADLTLVAGSDVNVTAGRLEAGDQAYLVGGGNVNLLAAKDEDYDFYEKKVGGGLFGGSNQRDEVTDTRAVGTTVETGGDLTIASGGDQTYEAARLDSGEDLSLT